MKNITILRGSKLSHKSDIQYEVIESDKYVIVRQKKDSKAGKELKLIADDGQSLLYSYDSKLKGYKQHKRKYKRLSK